MLIFNRGALAGFVGPLIGGFVEGGADVASSPVQGYVTLSV